MPHHDEKGRISPAQSKVAKAMGGRTMAQQADAVGPYPVKHERHRFGEKLVYGSSGMARLEKLKEANKGKAAKSRVILRGRKGGKSYEQNPAWVKGYSEVRKGHDRGFTVKKSVKGFE